MIGHALPLVIGVLLCGGTLIARSALLERRLRELLDLEMTAREELAGREAELARLNARLLEDSRRDPLTGLRNRRALVEDLPDIELDARRHGQSFAIAICDVDRFKAYNDKLGHIAGDQALRAIAATVRMQLRAGDTAYRYGGEELVLVMRDTGIREALAAAERVRAAVESAALPHPADPRGVVTVSIGVASGKGDAPDMLSRADRALYEAKHGGRNGVRASEGEAARRPARRRRRARSSSAARARSSTRPWSTRSSAPCARRARGSGSAPPSSSPPRSPSRGARRRRRSCASGRSRRARSACRRRSRA